MRLCCLTSDNMSGDTSDEMFKIISKIQKLLVIIMLEMSTKGHCEESVVTE